MWHSQQLLEHFIWNSVEVAIPIAPSVHGEWSARTKARTAAKTLNAKKPDKFAYEFYAISGSVNPFTVCLITIPGTNQWIITEYSEHWEHHATMCTIQIPISKLRIVSFSNIDFTYCFYVQEALHLIDAKLCGFWCLVRAYDEHPDSAFNQ